MSVLLYAQNAREDVTLRATVKEGSGVVHKLEKKKEVTSWMELVPEEQRAPSSDAAKDAASLIGSALDVLKFKHDGTRLASEINKKKRASDETTSEDGTKKKAKKMKKTAEPPAAAASTTDESV
jgi:hypothetical protein